MENREHFGTLTERMHSFREELLNTEASIDATRAVLATQAYQEHADKPLLVKRAFMLKNILENMPIFIEPQTLLAGNQAKKNRAAPVFPEYAMDWVIKELDEFKLRDGDVFQIDEETKEELKSIAPYWYHNTTLDKGLAMIPPESRIFYDLGIIKAEGNITSGDAHIAVDYGKIMRKGLRYYEQRTLQEKRKLDMSDPDSISKYHFYEAILIVIAAVQAFARRYAERALAQAEAAQGKRKQELQKMAQILDRVPYEPAENFREAIQSMWLVHLVLQIESNGHSLSYGRMDQYLYPYVKHDLDTRVLQEEQVVELLTNLWLKTFTINKVRSWSHTQFSAGSPLYQNVTVGGQTHDGQDAVNMLSFLILKSVAQTRLPQPNLTVRYHRNLSAAFMDEAIEVVKLGTGMPAFNSDEVIIPSFMEKGVGKEDAYNYSAIGCVETAVPGKWGYRCTGMSFLNFPKTLLIAMNAGVDPASQVKLVEGLTHFSEMTSYAQLQEAWDITIREFTRHSVIIENCCDLVLEQDVPDVLCSALTEDCIGRGKTIKEGGAVYDFISGLQVGIANLADSLAAVKKLVFEEQKITADQLWDALMDDFTSPQHKAIQQMLIADAPKYGNDNDYVDQLIVDAYDVYINEVKKYPNTRYGRGPIGGTRYAGTSSISANVGQGKGTLATPDGRNAATPLAEGCSPSHGMDKNGPTAVFKTVSKLPTHEITGGVLLNQKMTPQMLSSEENKQKLEMMIRTFFNRLDGYHVQYNVVSRDTLLDAQKHPQKHRDLIVRVAGYSAFFNVLSRQTQDDIIERTEQTL